jgi:1-deoxy-D-xylulose 5-phosphate reductoisomerase
MGRKITIDSATMMNKGLEVIEAHHLFQMPVEQAQVAVHPQSISTDIEFYDGSVLAQLGIPDMRILISTPSTPRATLQHLALAESLRHSDTQLLSSRPPAFSLPTARL